MVQMPKRRANASESESSNSSGHAYCDCRKCPAGTEARFCRFKGGLGICAHGIVKYGCRNTVCNPKQAQVCSQCNTWKSVCAYHEIGSCPNAKGLA